MMIPLLRDFCAAGFFFLRFFLFFFSFLLLRSSSQLSAPRPVDVTTIPHRSHQRTRSTLCILRLSLSPHPQSEWRRGVQQRRHRPIPTLTIPTAFSMQRDVRENNNQQNTQRMHMCMDMEHAMSRWMGAVCTAMQQRFHATCSQTDSAPLSLWLWLCLWPRAPFRSSSREGDSSSHRHLRLEQSACTHQGATGGATVAKAVAMDPLAHDAGYQRPLYEPRAPRTHDAASVQLCCAKASDWMRAVAVLHQRSRWVSALTACVTAALGVRMRNL